MECGGENSLDRASRGRRGDVCELLGGVMSSLENEAAPALGLFDVVALLADRSERGIGRGSVGTVVELLGETDVLVEFADDHGRAYAIEPCPRAQLLGLKYVPQAA